MNNDEKEKHEERTGIVSIVEGMSKDEFTEWLILGNPKDISFAIKELESKEMYEYCAIAKKVRDKLYRINV